MNQPNCNYFVETNKVIVNESVLAFDYPIGEFLEISGMLIVELKLPYKIVYNENVFGINLEKGAIAWRIAKRDYTLPNCPFHGLRIFEGQLQLFNWCSFYLIVNPLNGEIIEEGFTK